MYCEYYQAKVLKKKTWFLSAVIRNESNVALARAVRDKNDTFEFFVPKDQEDYFLKVISLLKNKGIILDFIKASNNLITI